MAKGKEIKAWITINGNHVPIYSDGSLGGVYEKIKASGSGKKKSQMRDDNDPANKTDHEWMEEENKRWEKEYGKEDSYQWEEDEEDLGSDADKAARVETYKEQLRDVNEDIEQFESTSPRMRAADYDEKLAKLKEKKANLEKWIDRDTSTKKSSDIDEDKLDEIAERYNGSKPVSGDWDTETEHEQKAIAKEFGISMDEAKQVMKDKLGFDDDMFPAKGQEGGRPSSEFVVDYPLDKEDPKEYDRKRRERELADEVDAYDREHGEGKYEKESKVDGGEEQRLGVYKEQLADVQDEIKQFEGTRPALRAPDYDEKLAALKAKEKDLKSWIDRDEKAAGETNSKHYAVYQPSTILGTEHHSRLERVEADSEEEAVRKYKEKYPDAKDDKISLHRTTENGGRYQNEDGSWDDGHSYKSNKSDIDKEKTIKIGDKEIGISKTGVSDTPMAKKVKTGNRQATANKTADESFLKKHASDKVATRMRIEDMLRGKKEGDKVTINGTTYTRTKGSWKAPDGVQMLASQLAEQEAQRLYKNSKK